MKATKSLSLVLLLLCPLALAPRGASASGSSPAAPPLASVGALDAAARRRTSAAPRLALADSSSDRLKGVEFADPLETKNVPNYLRALAGHTQAAPHFARLVRTFLYGGTLAPETKMAMALRVAQVLKSPYAAAHAQRWLRASAGGRETLAALRADKSFDQRLSEQLALRYAESLTRGVHDVSDGDFQKLRAHYNDSQIVELTMAVCFFNYFARMAEATNLPVEAWALDEAAAAAPASPPKYSPPHARVALISDEEIAATSQVAAAAKEPQKPSAGLGLGVANSQRAMLRVPALALAWRAYGAAVREHATVGRDIQLQVSFAVSTANGCRYCTIHQVLGLRRLGVSPAKLVSMKKDDSSLTPRELAAVAFARKMTADPSSVTDGDFAALKKEFGEAGAFEVTLQTSAFSFMNRFTDGLRLPSEDEAVRVYKETYGSER